MKLVMTIMVRDEADIIEAMLEFHLSQGVDFFIVTDNGSVDGTTQILEKFEARGVLELRHDPTHAKQQGRSVTLMARDAYRLHGADWIINADADEFWLPTDRNRNLKEVFEEYDPEWKSFTVEVTDMIGPPAVSGSGLGRLVFEDKRSPEELRIVGLRGHSTHNAVHIGSADVTVSQGNHFVSIESMGRPSAENDIQVLHFQWRSWEQFERKVKNAGRAYENSIELTPSPRHHGMLDYQRWKEGTLEAWYVARHPENSKLGSSTFPKVDFPEFPTSPVSDVLYLADREHELRAYGENMAMSWVAALRAEENLAVLEMAQTLLRSQQLQIETLDSTISELNATLKRPLAIAKWWFKALRSKLATRN